MSDFISSYLEHTKDYESPSSFWRWSAFATISAVLRDNVYRTQGESFIFPNLYVLLLADSSVHRKGRPVDTAELLVSHVNNTKLVSGSTSIQALIDELARIETDPNTGKLKKAGSGVFLAQELSAALVEDPRAIKILTDIYDYKPLGYSVRLISRAHAKVDKLVLSLFAASNLALLRDLFTNQAVYGGLLARTFIIAPDEFRQSNSLWEVPNVKSFECIQGHIKQVAELRGEMDISQESKNEYDSWYKPFRMSYRDKNEKSGIVGRIHTSILKLAMILAANDLEMCIRKKHVEQAIHEGTALLPNYRMFLMSTGSTRNKEELGGFVLETMLKAKNFTVTRRTLLQQPAFIQPEGAELLDKLMVMLEQGGLTTSMISSNISDDTKFCLTVKGIELLKGT